MQLSKVAFSFALIIFLSFNLVVIESKDVKVFKRGKITLIDETQFKHPYDYEFTDDQDDVDLQNIYDEKVPYLPKFVLHKNGFDQGFTRVPIVTRKGENTWSTPRPTTLRGEEYKTWGTPKILPITKPTPSRGDLARTTPVPKTTFVARFSSPPPTKAEKPAKKPEVKQTTTSTEAPQTVTKLKKFFTRRPTSSESTTSATEAPIIPVKKQFFTRRPTTTSTSTEASREITKSKERKLTTSSSVETITEDFTTDFTRKSFKKPKTTTTASAEETTTKKKQFTRRPTTTTSASSEEPNTSTSKKQFTRRPRPTSTEAASTESSTDATTARRKFTRRPTSTESTTEASTEASTRRKFFTRRPKLTSTEASTESSTEASTTKRKFTRRPTTTSSSASTESKSTEVAATSTRRKFTRRPTSTESTTESPTTEATTKRRFFTRRPKPTTTTEEPTTEATTMLPLKDRLRPLLTTREPTPTMPRRFRVFTNPSPAEPPTDELNPQQQIESQRKLKEKLSFAEFAGNQEFSSKHPIVVSNIINGHGGVEQTVKSNAIILQAQKNPFFLPSNVTPNPSLFSSSQPSTAAPEIQNRWSSSWSSWTSWDANGQKITGSTKTFTTFDTSTTPAPVSRHRQLSHTRTEEPSTVTSTSTRRTSPSRSTFKPHVIHHGRHRYRGPTFNCRVLTPNEDGRPSPNNDSSCELKFPGFPADDSCRCRYDVEARDSNGCATGFLYTCKRVSQRT